MQYQLIERNERHVEAISKALKKARRCIWRPTRIARAKRSPGICMRFSRSAASWQRSSVHRVVFHEITRNAIRAAVAAPRELSLDLVNAQQARRALDYLVGFNLSPLLWKKVRRGLSAGRVQSPALRMICEREAEIAAFVPQEYWSIDSRGRAFRAGPFRSS
jgi:DNA topoisomerase-1